MQTSTGESRSKFVTVNTWRADRAGSRVTCPQRLRVFAGGALRTRCIADLPSRRGVGSRAALRALVGSGDAFRGRVRAGRAAEAHAGVGGPCGGRIGSSLALGALRASRESGGRRVRACRASLALARGSSLQQVAPGSGWAVLARAGDENVRVRAGAARLARCFVGRLPCGISVEADAAPCAGRGARAGGVGSCCTCMAGAFRGCSRLVGRRARRAERAGGGGTQAEPSCRASSLGRGSQGDAVCGADDAARVGGHALGCPLGQVADGGVACSSILSVSETKGTREIHGSAWKAEEASSHTIERTDKK